MAIRSFKDLVVWQKSYTLTVHIYKEFKEVRDYSFRDQIQRASVSIMNNIAEGYVRRSDKALINYLRIASGSNSEVESMVLVAVDLGYVDSEAQQALLIEIAETGKLLNAFINKLSANR